MTIRLYLDASVLVSLYIPETTSAAAEFLVKDHKDLAVSTLTLLETRIALDRQRKAGKIPISAVDAVRIRMDADVISQRLQFFSIDDNDYLGADKISQKVQVPIRSLDAFHTAVVFRRGFSMATLDRRLHIAALSMSIDSRWIDTENA